MQHVTNTTFTSCPLFRETTYFYTEEIVFRIKLKRNYLFALWAASLLGYTRQTAENYIKELTIAELQPFSDGTILPKVVAALKAAAIDVSADRVQKAFDQCWEAAYTLVMKDEEGALE